jgi:hypothetical protein
MSSLSRRTLLAGTAATAVASQLSPASAAKASPEKKAFMQAVIKDLNVDLNSTEEAQRKAQIQRVCIPVPFADFDYYYTLGTLAWSAAGLNLPDTTVPNGFCTDLASVPRLYWALLPKTGKYAYAAIVHDYLYWTQTTTRAQADEVLKAAMQDSNVGSATINAIYLSVRGFGGSSWTANAKAKQAGEKRFLKTFPADGQLVSWADWKKDRTRFSD